MPSLSRRVSRLVLAAALFVPALALASDAADAPAQAPGIRLGTDVVPARQAVELTVDARRKDYRGSTRVELEVRRAIRSFRFHAEEMSLDAIMLDGAGGKVTLEAKSGKHGEVTVTAPRELAPGPYVLTIDFHNDFETRAVGLYRLETGGEAYLFTQFEAVDARKAFPCWDEPSFKIPFQVTLTVPAAHVAVSNSPVESETAAGDQRVVRFATTPPLPSYLVAIATGPFDVVPIPGMRVPARVVSPKGTAHLTSEAIRLTPPLLAVVEEYFGRPYPYAKLDLIAVPEYWYGAMENAGAITFRDEYLLLDPAAISHSERRFTAQIIAHELAHHWFGNLTTMDWWDDLWLNEAFAYWMGHWAPAVAFPELADPTTALGPVQGAMGSDSQLTSHAIRQPVVDLVNLLQSSDALTNNKGEAVIAMIESWLGRDVFRAGVRRYIDEHAWGSAVAKDLWNALSAVSGKDVGTVMASFLDQPGVPLVSAALDGPRVRLRQSRFLTHGTAPTAQLWAIPIVLRYPGGDGRPREERVLLREAEQTFALPGAAPRPEWIHPNVGEGGYYRWQVEPKVLDHLTRNSLALLSVRERAGLMRQIGPLFIAGQLDAALYLQTLERFADDPAPQVIDGLLGALDGLGSTFYDESLEPDYAAYLRRTLEPALRRFGMRPVAGEPSEVSLVRPDLLEILGDRGGSPEVRAYGRELAGAYLRDPRAVDPSLSGVALRLAALDGDAALWEAYRRHFEEAKTPVERATILPTLGAFRDPALIAKTLRYNLEGPLRPQEIGETAFVMAGHPPLRPTVFAWMTRSYAAIAARIPPAFMAYAPWYGAGCSRDLLDRTLSFFSQPEYAPPGTEVELAKVKGVTETCLALRDRELEAVRRYLTSARPS